MAAARGSGLIVLSERDVRAAVRSEPLPRDALSDGVVNAVSPPTLPTAFWKPGNKP